MPKGRQAAWIRLAIEAGLGLRIVMCSWKVRVEREGIGSEGVGEIKVTSTSTKTRARAKVKVKVDLP